MKARFSIVIVFLLMLGGMALSQEAASDEVIPKGYQIGPGDEITGKVFGEKDYDFVAMVDEDGRIEVPFSEKPIMAKCRTDRDLRLEIEQLLSRELRNPKLSLQISKRKRLIATVYGEVNLPGQIEMQRQARLVELIAYSGGVKEEAGGVVQVFRTQRPMCTTASDETNWLPEGGEAADVPSKTFSLANVKTGKDEANPIILPGDVIFVHKAPPIYITGEVQTPQGIYLKEGGLTLTEAIAKVGGVRREAKTKDIKIYRLKAGAKDREIIAANYDQIKKGTQKDVPLEPNDIIEVDRAKDSIAMSILKMAIGAGRAGITTLSQTGGMRVIY